MRRPSLAAHLLLGAVLLSAAPACDDGAAHRSATRDAPRARTSDPSFTGVSPWPEDGTPLERTSASGRHRVSIRPSIAGAERARHHAWEILVADRSARPARVRRLAFAATMPAHGHGLPTVPRIVAADEAGWIRVRGVRFHMGGHWQIRVEFDAEQGGDVAIFDVDIPH